MEIKSSGPTKRKDGRYQAYAYNPGGKRRYVYDDNRQACKAKLTELIEEMESGVVSSNMLFKDYVVKWQEVDCASLAPTSRDTNERKVKGNLLPVLGDKKIKDIKRKDIQTLINNFGETHSEKSSKDLTAIAHRIFECAKMDKIVKENPCKKIAIKKTAPYEYNIYTVDQMLDYVKAVKGTEFEIPILLAAFCGLRLSEICGLKWENVDFKRNTITVTNVAVVAYNKIFEKIPKTQTSIRTIPMPELVSETLKKTRGIASGYVCPSKDGSAQNGKNLSKRISRYRKKIGFPPTRFHDLRHFYATVMLINGISDKQTAQVLGHSNTNMTLKYQHIMKSIEERPANVINTITSNLTPELTPNSSNAIE